MQNFSDLCKNQSPAMKNNYSRKSQNETCKGGKRIGKSLPPKSTGFTKSKSTAAPKITTGDQKFAATGKK